MLIGMMIWAGLLAGPPQSLEPGERAFDEIPYVTCDGTRWRAALDGERFLHSPADPGVQPEAHEELFIRYRTWGGGCWRATWSAYQGRFNHTPVDAGETHPDTILNFEDWEGERWTARRDGDVWIVRRP